MEELFRKAIKESQDRAIITYGKSAFCLVVDGEFPDDPHKRHAEIINEQLEEQEKYFKKVNQLPQSEKGQGHA